VRLRRHQPPIQVRRPNRTPPILTAAFAAGITVSIPAWGVAATSDIAVQIAAKLIEAGHSADVGIMQINSGNFARLGLTLQAAFDPCKSVAAAATIRAGDYNSGETHEAQQSALRAALSRYNTGDAQRGLANGYV
jgi:type IV secretion system protein VirB1